MARPAFVRAAFVAVSEKTSPSRFNYAKIHGKHASVFRVCGETCDPGGGGGDPFSGSPTNHITLDSRSGVDQYGTTGAASFDDNAANDYLDASFDGSSQYVLGAPQDGIANTVPAVATSDVPRDQWVQLYGSSVYISSDETQSWLITSDGHHVHLVDNPGASEVDVVDQDAGTTYAVPYAWLNSAFQTAWAGGTHMEAASVAGRACGGVAAGVVALAALNTAYNTANNPAVKFLGLAGPWGRAASVAIIVGAGAVGAFGAYRAGNSACGG
jgi:hypothetical protein